MAAAIGVRGRCHPPVRPTFPRGIADVELLIVGLAVVAGAVVIVGRRARRDDAVDDFRRQIDALGPDARRRVTDEVRRLDDDGHEVDPSTVDDAANEDDADGA